MENTIEANNSEDDGNLLLELTSDVISSYVSNNTVSTADLPTIINDVYAAFNRLAEEEQSAKSAKKELSPAVPVKKSVQDDYIICLEDGKQFKSLKRHLSSHYGLSPDEYREKWGLPPDYPMVAPSYAKKRSRLAKQIGLGRKPAKAA